MSVISQSRAARPDRAARPGRDLEYCLSPRVLRRALLALPIAVAFAAGCDADRGTASTVAPLDVAAAPGSGQPHLAVTPSGEAVLSWLQPAGDRYELNFSRLGEDGWSEPHLVASGSDFFVNWADYPSVEPITEEVWAAHWLKMAPDSFASYDVAVSFSDDAGGTWSEGFILNDDGALTEHGFVSLFPWGEDIGAVWLDGRLLAEQFESGEFDENAPPVGMSLRYARLSRDGEMQSQGQLDELACDCCQTDAASSTSGPVIVYRDRTHDEIRDNVVLRFADARWQPPVTLGPDNWRIEGCPVNGPAVAARGEDVVAAWFTAADDAARTRFARSRDGGASFDAPVEIDAEGSFGHVDVVLLADGAAVVSWWRRAQAGGIELTARRVERDGELGAPQRVGRSDSAQPLDVPQMVSAQGKLIFAWTDAGEETIESAAVVLEQGK